MISKPHAPSRRQLLQIGSAGLMGLALPRMLPAAEGSSRRKAKTKAVIFLHQFGGPSQFETFDMKPSAPAEIRGTFKPIASKQVGLQVCELLPQVAKVADKLTVIRSVQHRMTNHNSAGYYSLAGFTPTVDDQRLRDSLELFPAFGSIVDKFAPAPKGIPTFVSYPHVLRDGSVTPGQHASFLGKLHDPFFFTQDANAADFRLPELSLPANISLERMQSRKEMLKLIEAQTDLIQTSTVASGMDDTYQKAVAMLGSKQLKKAFDLSEEKATTRDRYGRTTYGQGCLLARRLVESGVKFINVYLSASIGGTTGWDTHGFDRKPMDPILKQHLLPIADQTLSALIEDLTQRGMLDETLVVWMGEFGRSPRINNLAGRDHWPHCYTVVMAGGGLKQGIIHGASDKRGAYPAVAPVQIEDISATFYELLGIDPATEIQDKLGRPFPISKGAPIREIIA